jgi:putative pyruvate formate lyase activating enzyme
MDADTLSRELLKLQARGAHNVNFVTPTPHVPQLAEAVLRARERGLRIPVVYNTNGYDSPEALALLDGIVDIYLPDAKYRSRDLAGELSGTPGYVSGNDDALAEMVRQVGFLSAGEDGIATRGVLVRHLVLPGMGEETEAVLAHLADAFGHDLPLSLMGQYFPAWKAPGTPGLDRKLSKREYGRAVATASRLAFRDVFIQEL